MTRHLAAVSEAALRDGIYIRVSAVMGRADERFLSPDIQREAIDRARNRGPASRVVDEWRDIDVSTARVAPKDRPGLQQALVAAREGRIDRLWVLTLDRFDRDTAALKTFDEVAALDVELWAEAGRIDVESPEGYLSTTMQLAIARYQRDRIGKAWRQTHLHRLERGLPHSGKARAGYIYDRQVRLHVPDPVAGAAIAEAYRRYVNGDSIYALVRWLNEQGSRTTEGNLWRDRVLRRCLDSGFAAGILTYDGTQYDGVHQPLITRELWDQYIARRNSRRSAPNVERSQYVLSGLVRCGHPGCGAAMVAGQFGSNHEPKYRCSAGKETGVHTGGYVMQNYLEAHVLAWLAGIAGEVDAAIDLNARANAARIRSGEDVERVRREVGELERQSGEAARHLLSGRFTDAEYDTAARDTRAALDAARRRLVAAEAERHAPTAVDPQKAAMDLLDAWGDLPVTSRREALRRLIRRVEVTSGRPRAQIHVVPIWDEE